MTTLRIDFAGERHELDGSTPFQIGREGDLRIDENPFLHRRFLELRWEHDLWWVVNVGSQLSATVSDHANGVNAWLAPGGRMPLVFEATVLRFTAGPTQYELLLELDDAPYVFEADAEEVDGTTTAGRVSLTPDQKLLLVVLAESALRAHRPGAVDIPSSSSAARRLGWTLKKFEKKLDNVCEKLTAQGVRGLKGEQGNLASGRRARLVEHALAARLVTAVDLVLLDAHRPTADGDGGPDR